MTLLEVVVVLSIAALLVAVAVPTLTGARRSGFDRAAILSRATTVEAARTLAADTGTLASAVPGRLGAVLPDLVVVDGSEASTGPEVVSVAASGSRWGMAVRSRSGTCYLASLRPAQAPLLEQLDDGTGCHAAAAGSLACRTEPGFLSSTGSVYEVVTAGRSWGDALLEARTRSRCGRIGHLVTVTSAMELTFVRGLLAGNPGWFGATDVGVEGSWRWQAGPEDGAAAAIPWRVGDPNGGHGENCLLSDAHGLVDAPCWDDLRYVVEYSDAPPVGPLIYLAANDTWYEYVPATLTWGQALHAAGQRTHLGRTGHLVTLSSGAELDAVVKVKGARGAWAAATDGAQEGTWRWMAGAETGLQFSAGAASWSGRYAPWNGGSPDDAGSREHCGVLGEPLRLTDAACNGTLPGYVVEYPPSGGAASSTQLYDAATDTWYERVPASVNWGLARWEASNRLLSGRRGHLAVLDTPAEADVAARLHGGSDLWVAASDGGAEGVWRWLAGPQDGVQFSSGAASAGGRYAPWFVNEPNDLGGEHCAAYGAGLRLWDVSCDQTRSYLVEYPPGGGPAPQSTWYDAATDTWYERVSTGMNWGAARFAATTRTLMGRTGHLMTVETPAEVDIANRLGRGVDSWLAAGDMGVEGTWRWLAGPSDGVQFSSGSTPVGGWSARWQDNEPNNHHGANHCGGMWVRGRMDDGRCEESRMVLVEYPPTPQPAEETTWWSAATDTWYEFVDVARPWGAALRDAAARTAFGGRRGHLVAVDGAIDLEAVNRLGRGHPIWTASSDAGVEGTWRWMAGATTDLAHVSGGAPVSGRYNSWVQGEVLTSSSDEHCAFTGPQGRQGDESCDRSYRYVVEYPPAWPAPAAQPVFSPSTGSWYRLVTTPATWSAAQAAAAATTHDGRTGHLVTIASAAEHDVVLRLAAGHDIWLGARDATTEGQWQWDVGPGSPLLFWSGAAWGSTVGGRHAAWRGGQPDDAGGQDCAAIGAFLRWSDESCSTARAYLIEYSP